MAESLLSRYFNRLPAQAPDEDVEHWFSRLGKPGDRFQRRVGRYYTEGTLQRLLNDPGRGTRLAAVLALRYLGTMSSNLAVAGRLQDADADIVTLACETLWALWFRADTPEHNRELQRLIHLRDAALLLDGLSGLLERAPQFAEAHNQRAIVHFREHRYDASITDCQRVLALNPVHFGAQVGMAQCYLRLHKRKSALEAFRQTQRIHPRLSGLAETIRSLERSLGN